jgi:hypothetical protein
MPNGRKSAAARERVALCLAAGRTAKGAAAACGVGERTVRRWQADPDFAGRVAALRRQLAERAAGRLAGLSGRAAATLRRLLDCGHPPTEGRAALGVLDQVAKYLDLQDHEARIRALEEQQAKPGAAP